MKKKTALLFILALTGCSEKQQYEQAVLEKMQTEKEISDYKITPEKITECIVMTSEKKMPGLFLADPTRLQAYKNYTKMLQLEKSADPKKTLEELRSEFGSAKGLADAHSNYTESYMECISGLVTGGEEDIKAQQQP